MVAFPTAADLTGATLTEAQFKTGLNAMLSAVVGLLGSTGDPAQSLAAIGAPFAAVLSKTAAYTVTLGDRGRVLACTGSWTLSLPAVATAGAGFVVTVVNTGSGAIVIDPAAAEIIDGATYMSLLAGHGVILFCTGSTWVTLGRPVTQSAMDSTAGRMLKVGDFGLGGLTPLRGDIGVTDASLPSGLYAYDTSLGSTGGPSGVTRAQMLHLRRAAAGGEAQILVVEVSTSAAYLAGMVISRSRVTGAWTAWIAGSVVESSSNANGRWMRFQDGTQICWQPVTTLTGGEATAFFPAPFLTTTGLMTTLGVNASAVFAISPRFTGRTATGCSVSAFNTSNARVATQVEMVTMGRWY